MIYLSFQIFVIILIAFEFFTISFSCVYIFIHLSLTLIIKFYSQNAFLLLVLFIRKVENFSSNLQIQNIFNYQ